MTALLDAQAVMPDVRVLDEGLLSAGQPTEPQLRALAAQGLRAVLNLRDATEHDEAGERTLCLDLAVDYLQLPIGGIEALDFGNARKLDAALGALPRPLLIHCASGNRVGALLALRHFLAHGDGDAAMRYGAVAGMSGAASRVRTLLETGADSPNK